MAQESLRQPTRRRPPQPSRPPRSRKFLHLALIFVALLVVMDALVGDRGLVAMLRARREYDQLATTIAKQRTENARLAEAARRLREDPTAIEEVARRELGLIRPGERVFIVRDVPQPPPTPQAGPTPQSPAPKF